MTNNPKMKKSILLTGALGGIGIELIYGLSNQGSHVIATDHPEKKIKLSLKENKYSWIPQDLNLLIGNKSAQNNLKIVQSKLKNMLKAIRNILKTS